MNTQELRNIEKIEEIEEVEEPEDNEHLERRYRARFGIAGYNEPTIMKAFYIIRNRSKTCGKTCFLLETTSKYYCVMYNMEGKRHLINYNELEQNHKDPMKCVRYLRRGTTRLYHDYTI